MNLAEPTPFSGPRDTATPTLHPILKQVVDETLAHVSALNTQHKALCSLLRSLHRDEIQLREQIRAADMVRWARVGRAEWTQMQERFILDEARLKASVDCRSEQERGGGMDILQHQYGERPLGMKSLQGRRKRKAPAANGSGGNKKARENESGHCDNSEAVELSDNMDAEEAIIDPFMDFIELAMKRPKPWNQSEEFCPFDPYVAGEGDDSDDYEGGSFNAGENAFSVIDSFFGSGDNDIEDGSETVSAIGATTPSSFASTPHRGIIK